VTGVDVFLAFAPERIDPGNRRFTLRTTPKVVGGVDDASTEVARQALLTIVDVVTPVRDATTAEMVKVLENTFRMINIGFANEVAQMCRRLGVDVWEVIGAPPPNRTDSCRSIRVPALGGTASRLIPHICNGRCATSTFRTRFIDLGNDVNRGMPDYVVQRADDVLNDIGRSMRGSRILLVGLRTNPTS